MRGYREITLPWPPKELSPNARVHWGMRARKAKRYRSDCFFKALEQIGRSWVPPNAIWVHLEFCPPNANTPDDDNCEAAFKSGRDGVSDAIRCDDRNWTVTRSIGAPVKNGAVKLTITRRE